MKVVGDYVDNYKHGLPSEVALLTLFDPRIGIPRAIMDATDIATHRTGAPPRSWSTTGNSAARGGSCTR